MSADGVNKYEREKLYEEVWNSPVTHVAKSYGVSDVAIHKICKAMNIPTPRNGYWTKLRAGKEVHKPPLPPEIGSTVKFGMDPNNRISQKDNTISFLSEEEQEKLIHIASSLKIDQNKNHCKEVQEHKQEVSEWNKNNESIEGKKWPYSEYKYHHRVFIDSKCIYPPVLAGVISKDVLIRVYGILNALIYGIKQLGYTVNDDMSFQIRGEKVPFYIYEKQSDFEHIITNEEVKKMERYKNKKKHDPWDYEPYIPLHDYKFNGKLLFRTKEFTCIQDKDDKHIEDYLPNMLIQLVQQSEILRVEYLKEEEKKRKRDEEKRLRELPIVTYNSEIDKLALLLNEANDLDTAMKIRVYANYVQQKDSNNQNAELISWANDKADWYDSIINKCDSILGIRDHNGKCLPPKKDIPYYWI